MRRFLVGALLAATVSVAVTPGTAEAFDEGGGSVPDNLTYSFDTSPYSFSQAYKDRAANAATEWSAFAEGSVTFNSSSTNLYEQVFQDAPASATLGCDGSGCRLFVNRVWVVCDRWYTGTGTSTGTSQYIPVSMCAGEDGNVRGDFWGAITHELGHWRGLDHNLFGTCQPSGGSLALYAPKPTREIATMCYHRTEPATEGGTGSAGVDDQRTISQDEVQGMVNKQDNLIVANRHLNNCDATGTLDMPKYWMSTPTANRYCAGGIVSLNNNSTHPYPELYQRARGADVDGDNDGRFAVRAWVTARDNAVSPRAVVFVRHVHASGVDHEMKCDSTPLPLHTQVVVDCGFTSSHGSALNLADSGVLEFEYGVRVTEKIDISRIEVRDL